MTRAIPRVYLENYSALLNRLSDSMRARLLEKLAKVDYSDVTPARIVVVEIMNGACAVATDEAAIIASDFYDGIREWQIGERLGAEPESERDPYATEGAVRAFAQDLAEGKPVESFTGKCADRLDYEIRRAANECIARNARRDPRKPKWARVPTGAETCEFCIMLASRGFAYHSEETASHAHAHCDCRIVPSWDKSPTAQGYDPDRYYDMWKHSEKYKDDANLQKLIEGFEDLSTKYARRKELADEMSRLAKRMKRMGRDEWGAAKADWDSMKAEYDDVNASLSLAADLQSKAVRKAVGQMRTLGPEPGKHASDYFDMSSARAVTQTIEDALPYIPRDWLDVLSQSGMKVKSMRRGSRSYFDNDTNTLHLASGKDKLTAVHELMHAMDSNSAAFFADSEAYFLRRTAGKPVEKLSDLSELAYEDYELAYNMGGECIHPYAYKIYGDPQARQFASFEVASIGVEYLYRKPWAFAKDPELLSFVVHKLKEV